MESVADRLFNYGNDLVAIFEELTNYWVENQQLWCLYIFDLLKKSSSPNPQLDLEILYNKAEFYYKTKQAHLNNSNYTYQNNSQAILHEHLVQGLPSINLNLSQEEQQTTQISLFSGAFGQEVDTYQIAVPNGDCSIHLLVERFGEGRGKILQSVLMDGGNDGRGVGDETTLVLEKAILQIRSLYDDPDSSTDAIRFDAWVVTHWDNDHWAGTLQMIKNDIIARNDIRSKYMKYDSNGKPGTVLYCPNWTKVPEYLDRPELEAKASLLKKKPNVLYIDDTDTAEFYGTGIVNLEIAENHKVENLCVAKWSVRMLLGVDFFTGNSPLVPQVPGENQDVTWEVALNKYFETFWHLQGVMSKIYGNQPRFLCVGAAGFLLGAKITDETLAQALAAKLSGKGNTWANFSSIISVDHFPGKQHISLYYAGDAVTIMEKKVIAPFQGYEFTVAKWSHHGSRHSNPVELWENMKPKKCIVSANKTGQYMHPDPEVLERFYEYCGTNYFHIRQEGRNPVGYFLYSTFYPGWIIKQTQNAFSTLGGREGINTLEDTWEELSPVQEQGIAQTVCVLDTGSNTFEVKDGFVPINVTGQAPYEMLFIHIRSSGNICSDGIVTPYIKRGIEEEWRFQEEMRIKEESRIEHDRRRIAEEENQVFDFRNIFKDGNNWDANSQFTRPFFDPRLEDFRNDNAINEEEKLPHWSLNLGRRQGQRQDMEFC